MGKIRIWKLGSEKYAISETEISHFCKSLDKVEKLVKTQPWVDVISPYNISVQEISTRGKFKRKNIVARYNDIILFDKKGNIKISNTAEINNILEI